MRAENPQIFTAKSEKNVALSLVRQKLKMDSMNTIQMVSTGHENYFIQNSKLAKTKTTNFIIFIPIIAAVF